MDNHINPKQRLLSQIMDLGEMLLKAGAEVNRVENTVSQVGCAYGFTRVDVFSITSSIVVSAHSKEGDVYTETRRITDYTTDFDKIEKINHLSRQICSSPLNEDELSLAIADIKNAKGYSQKTMLLTYGFISAVFSLFFGGTLSDALAAFFCGLLLRVIVQLGRRMQIQSIVLNFFTAIAVGLSAVGLIELGLGQSMDHIIIGNIMLLIPGMLLTTSLRDMINGDLVTGIMGLSDAILRSLALSFGFTLVFIWFGGELL